jgi:hypothetical protein
LKFKYSLKQAIEKQLPEVFKIVITVLPKPTVVEIVLLLFFSSYAADTMLLLAGCCIHFRSTSREGWKLSKVFLKQSDFHLNEF